MKFGISFHSPASSCVHFKLPFSLPTHLRAGRTPGGSHSNAAPGPTPGPVTPGESVQRVQESSGSYSHVGIASRFLTVLAFSLWDSLSHEHFPG